MPDLVDLTSAVDDLTMTSPQKRYSKAEKALLTGAVAMITIFAFESLATTTIMPSVVEALGSELWLPLAAGAPLAAQVFTCVICGPLVDARGAVPFLLGGVISFAVGLLLCGAAPSMVVFTLGRTIQGLGAGLAVVPLYVLVGAISTSEHRRTFFAAFSMAWVLPSLIGAPIAGFAAQTVGWRPVFWVVSILIFITLLPLLPLMRLAPVPSESIGNAFVRRAVYALIVAFGLLATQASAVIDGLISLVPLTLGLAVSLLALPTLLPAGTFSARPVLGAMIATRGLTIAANVAAISLIPMVLETVRGWDPAQASLVVAAGSISWAAGSAFQSRINQRRERLPRWGSVFLAVGMLPVLTFAFPYAPVWIGVVGWTLAGLGIGLTHATLSDLALEQTPVSKHGEVSSALQLADNAGPALALGFVSLALSLSTQSGVAPWFPALSIAAVIALLGVFAAHRIATAVSERE